MTVCMPSFKSCTVYSYGFESSWCLVLVERLFFAVPWGCLRFVIVVFPDHPHLLFLSRIPCKEDRFEMYLITIHSCTFMDQK